MGKNELLYGNQGTSSRKQFHPQVKVGGLEHLPSRMLQLPWISKLLCVSQTLPNSVCCYYPFPVPLQMLDVHEEVGAEVTGDDDDGGGGDDFGS